MSVVAAVIVPSLAKAAFSCGIFSGLPLPGCSSTSTVTSPLRVTTVTGVDFLVELAVGDRLVGAAKALDRVFVLSSRVN